MNVDPNRLEHESVDSMLKASDRDPDDKQAKPAGNKKSANNVKNMLFNLHKPEAKTIIKEPKIEEPARKKKAEGFQSPIVDKPEKKSMGSFTKPQTGMPTCNTPYMMTPGYESNMRNIEQMHGMYGSSYFDNNQMRPMGDFSGNQYPSMLAKSPFLQSPSPALRNFNRYGPETPQTGMSQRATWRNDGINLYGMVS
jgi:hypothetical protein